MFAFKFLSSELMTKIKEFEYKQIFLHNIFSLIPQNLAIKIIPQKKLYETVDS